MNYVAEREGTRMRDVVVASLVDWRDVATDVDGQATTGRYRVILMTRFASGSRSIDGEVLLLPFAEGGTRDATVSRLLARLHACAAAGEGVGSVYDELLATLRRDSPVHRRSALKRVEFRLGHDGLVLLRLHAADRYDIGTTYAAVRQAFYFVKNVWHVHKHHDRWDESLTTVHPLAPDLERVALDLLDDMKAAVTAAHRDASRVDRTGIVRARGILAYARALATTLAEQGLLSRRELFRESRYFDCLAESLAVADEARHRLVDERRHAHDRFRNFVLFVLATLAPVTLMYRDAVLAAIAEQSELTDHLLVELFTLFFGSAYGVLTGLVAIFGSYAIYALVVGRGARHYLARRRIVQWWIDTVAPHPVYGRLAAMALGALAAAFAVLAVALLAAA